MICKHKIQESTREQLAKFKYLRYMRAKDGKSKTEINRRIENGQMYLQQKEQDPNWQARELSLLQSSQTWTFSQTVEQREKPLECGET